MVKDYFKQLQKLEGAVEVSEETIPVLRTPSPSMNWALGVEGHGIPEGMSIIIWGPPKGGKSIVCNAILGQCHKDYEDGYTITFNTELRGKFQANKKHLTQWGIDPNRHISYDVNQPELIFDRICDEVDTLCQQGMNLKAIVIDSLTGIQGRRAQNADSILTQQIGDEALTLKDGLKMILPVIRKHNIVLIMTAHVRAELDQLQIRRGKKVKMAAAWATKHTAEFFAYVEPNLSKDGRKTLTGEEFLDKKTVDFMKKGEKTGHKIRFRIDESSVGPQGRTGEFTLSYGGGIINTHEEVFTLGCNLGVIERPNNTTYIYKDNKWVGKPALLDALKMNPVLCQEIMDEVYTKDTFQDEGLDQDEPIDATMEGMPIPVAPKS